MSNPTMKEYGNSVVFNYPDIDDISHKLLTFNAAHSDLELSKTNESFIDAGYKVVLIVGPEYYVDELDENGEPTGEELGPYWPHAWYAGPGDQDYDGIDVTDEVRKESYEWCERDADIERMRKELGIYTEPLKETPR